MSIQVQCVCGRSIRFSDEWAGKRRKCFYCGQEVDVPMGAAGPANFDARVPPPPPPGRQPAPADDLRLMPNTPSPNANHTPSYAGQRPSPSYAGARQAAFRPRRGPGDRPTIYAPAGGKTWNRRYLFLSLSLIPLVLSTLTPSDPKDVENRFKSTIAHLSKDEQARLNRMDEEPITMDKLVMSFPDHRVEGSYLPRDTWVHWGFALASACAFLTLLALLFPMHGTSAGGLAATGAFTGTAGIFLLLAFQWAAIYTQGVWVRGSGMVVLIFMVVKFIGFSYSAALDPDSGFLLSAMGFTCGVGFCEEVCKMIPLAWHFKERAKLDWRGACLWGLASGVGFGVSEGITYASNYYNGVHTGEIYLVRFISCVGLHAIWGGAAGITLYYRQYALQAAEGFFGHLWEFLQIVFVPMVLHGLYDTLLKKEMEGMALVAALASFGWLAYQIERMRRLEVAPPEPVAPVPLV